MTKEGALSIIEHGEGIRIEFKERRTDVPDGFYDTVSTSGTEKLNQVPLSSDLDGANPDQLMYSLVLGWHEQGTRMISLDWMLIKDLSTENWQKVPGWPEKGTRFLGKKGLYLMQLLVLCLEPASMAELLVFFKYNNRSSFRDRYIIPLLGEGLIERTLPEKPSSKFQRYKTSLKGKLLLGGTRVDSKRYQDQDFDDRLKFSLLKSETEKKVPR